MSMLNQILLKWQPGDIHSLDWFKQKGVEQRLAYSYYQNGYLEKVGPGVYKRKDDEINPFGLVRFLQNELGLKLHVSSRSSLELHGHTHFVPMGYRSIIYLKAYEEKSLPSWIKKLRMNFEISFKRSSLLKKESFLEEYNANGFLVKVSCRELAILELIDDLDLSGGLETAQSYVESLITLRSTKLQEVLESCNSIKVKRVFLYLAQKVNLPCLKDLKIEKIYLGRGKRVIVEGGELNNAYQITVDRDYGENPF
ncbi:MAG: type IV toxin-antitoxin system AbiEi family antitoxin domain-containing protein [Bacteriovoracaceae bacterium]|nr:type IV toxin-antitoxin system AbiEi family antitoxin domain-containing protein [Bacteriovoracaceae bacterium]